MLVRHGEAAQSTATGALGLPDPVLSATGRAQALALCVQLPAQVDSHHLLAHALCPADDRDPGSSPQPTQVHVPAQAAQQVPQPWLQAPPGSEPIAAVARRVSQGLQALRRQHNGGVVVLVTHGLVTQLVWALAGAGFDDLLDWQLPHGQCIHLRLGPPLPLPQRPPELTGNLVAALAPRVLIPMPGPVNGELPTQFPHAPTHRPAQLHSRHFLHGSPSAL